MTEDITMRVTRNNDDTIASVTFIDGDLRTSASGGVFGWNVDTNFDEVRENRATLNDAMGYAAFLLLAEKETAR